MLDKQLEELEELGELQFTVSDVCIIAGIDEEKITPTQLLAYHKGRLRASASVRKAILEQAENGNTAAQKQMMDLICNADTAATERKNLEELEKRDGLNDNG